MFLGTPRRWWIAAALLFVLGLVLIATGTGGTLGIVGGGLLIVLGMIAFAAAPMRYGQNARPPVAAAPPPAAPAPPAAASPQPRPTIEAGDASEV